MKKNVRRICVMLVALLLIACLSVSALAATYPYTATFDGRYIAEAYGILTATRASASVSVYDIENDDTMRGVARYARVDYKYYPSDGAALATAYKAKSSYDEIFCSAVASTTTDSGIYLFRYAKFAFSATVPAVSGGYHYWTAESKDWAEYIPAE